MQSALDSAIGLPSRLTSASRILLLEMPLEVSRNFRILLLADLIGAEKLLESFLLGCDYPTCPPQRLAAGGGRDNAILPEPTPGQEKCLTARRGCIPILVFFQDALPGVFDLPASSLSYLMTRKRRWIASAVWITSMISSEICTLFSCSNNCVTLPNNMGTR